MKNPGAVAFLSEFDIDHPLEVLDPETYHGLGISFQYWNVHYEVAVKDIRVKVERFSVSQIHLSEFSLKHINRER